MHPAIQNARSLLLLSVALLAAIAPSRSAIAEYRAFQLAITNVKTNQSRMVLTTLDDIQYPGYHPLNADETIAIQDTWRCWERSDGFKDICPNPRATTNTRNPAGSASDKTASPLANSATSAP